MPQARPQFLLRHTFVILTGVALGCSLVAWLGEMCFPLLFVACGPFATILILNRTGGEFPLHAVLLGAGIQALLVGCILFVTEVLPTICSNGSLGLVLLELIVPVNFGLVGGLLSPFFSLPFLVLYYSVRKTRNQASRHSQAADSEPAGTEP